MDSGCPLKVIINVPGGKKKKIHCIILKCELFYVLMLGTK